MLVLLGIFSAVLPASAQERSGAVELRAGAALGAVKTDVGGESSTNVGPLLTAQLGYALSRGVDLTADLLYQPFKAESPLGFEEYTTVLLLGGAQIGFVDSKRTFVRPELGAAFSSWSGEDPWVPSTTNFAAGIAAGHELPLASKLGLVLEGQVVVWSDLELTSLTFLAGASLMPLGARRRD
jgi:hypothetical protein